MPKYIRKPRRKTFARRGRKQPWYNRRYSPIQVASAAWRGVKYLRSLINVEHQKVDQQVNTTISNTPNITHITAIAVGDAEGSRTGNSVLLKYLYLKHYYTINTSANFTRLRVVVVRDKQQIADTAPAYTDVYETTSTISLLNKNTVGRFDILYDRLVNMDAQRPSASWDKYIRLNSHVRYNGTANTDQQKGAIYLMVVSDQAVNTPTAVIQTRLMYIDN